ncbi:hypothetical protein BRADI_5g08825v3 [Brachypodium distachyon]|uniref:Uncharacterized protein n=1 Tax=Brachypodium distachyon TaxID=15368 RepID=A0A0Q3E422_BRADI|nr:hypothetical protein BRADI_5g08825v3 [Brachypodium distachyon]
MDVFIHEDYVNKRNEVRREQRKQLQMLQRRQTASRPAPACGEESPGAPSRCPTPTGMSSSTVRSPTSSSSAVAEEGVSSDHRCLFDCLKPY